MSAASKARVTLFSLLAKSSFPSGGAVTVTREVDAGLETLEIDLRPLSSGMSAEVVATYAVRNDGASPVTVTIDVAAWYGAATDTTGWVSRRVRSISSASRAIKGCGLRARSTRSAARST